MQILARKWKILDQKERIQFEVIWLELVFGARQSEHPFAIDSDRREWKQ